MCSPRFSFLIKRERLSVRLGLLANNISLVLEGLTDLNRDVMYSTNHVYLHSRPNAFGFWQTRLHLCYETLKRVSNFSELA